MLHLSRRKLLVASTLMASSTGLLAETPPVAATPRSRVQDAAQGVVDGVLRQLSLESRPAKTRPLVQVTTRFTIAIEMRDPQKPEIVLPIWEELGEPQKQLLAQLTQLAGTQVGPRTFFEDTFNWALVAHEVGHHFVYEQVAKDKRLNFFGQERQANQFMVAYWNTQPGARAKLDRCGEVWNALFSRMPSPVPKDADAEEHFNQNYEKLSQNPMAYGWYQFNWMAEAWRARDKLVFADVLRAAVAGQSITT
jgi:hypothetical protein